MIAVRKSLCVLNGTWRNYSSQIFQQESSCQRGPCIPLAGREYLAGSDDMSCPARLEYATQDNYDLFRLCQGQDRLTLADAATEISEVVKSQLCNKGALLFKGLSGVIKDNPSFSFMAAKQGEKFSYTAGFATREEFGDAPGNKHILDDYYQEKVWTVEGVMAAADDPPEVTIEPHLEMSYNKEMPGKIMFYCHHAPLPHEGGQTPICDMRKVYQDLTQHPILQPLLTEGLRYYRTLPSRNSSQGSLYSWEKTFFTEDRKSVEKTLTELGYDMEWTREGSLRYSYLMSAVRPHPRSGELVWANQSSVSHGSYYLHLPTILYPDPEFAPSHTAHRDGTPFSREELAIIRRVQWEQSRAVVWEEGDLLVLDNHAVGHGRMGFHAHTNRNLVVAIAK